jgi:signal transduction histidine kinase
MEGRVVAEVTDTGIGMPEHVKNKLFEPFFTTKKTGKGTGLGTSISYGIVKDYDGHIEVNSEPGKGTTFRLTFPCVC